MLTGSLPAVSNRETFQTERQLIDDETDEAIDLTDATIVFEIRQQSSSSAILSATLTNGKIVLLDDTTYQVTFSVTDMRTLSAGTYDVGLTIKRDNFTTQIIIGTLPVMDGIVS